MVEKNCKLCFHYDICYAVGRMLERAETCTKYAPDVVEVVRCRTCKHFKIIDFGVTICNKRPNAVKPVDGDFYCADGIKK